MPTILIDADGCPVVDLTVQIGRAHGVPVKILCDTAHRIQREGAETLVFDKGADSVDFALVNRVANRQNWKGFFVLSHIFNIRQYKSPRFGV